MRSCLLKRWPKFIILYYYALANFSAHVAQVRANINFLENLNSVPNSWDWKVTVCFYAAVHIVNAHLAQAANLHFRQHRQVDDAISPMSRIVAVRLTEDVYVSYKALKNLSRRSRYLCSDDGSGDPQQPLLTYDKHLKKALYHLNTLMEWFTSLYNINTFDKKEINCPNLQVSTFFAPLSLKSVA